jgi:chromosome segregation ATPase
MGGALSGIEQQLEEWRENRDPDARAHVKKLDEYAAGYRSQIKALEQQISNLDERIAEADREAEAIRLEMMKP